MLEQSQVHQPRHWPQQINCNFNGVLKIHKCFNWKNGESLSTLLDKCNADREAMIFLHHISVLVSFIERQHKGGRGEF
jgi:hypothetical protein